MKLNDDVRKFYGKCNPNYQVRDFIANDKVLKCLTKLTCIVHHHSRSGYQMLEVPGWAYNDSGLSHKKIVMDHRMYLIIVFETMADRKKFFSPAPMHASRDIQLIDTNKHPIVSKPKTGRIRQTMHYMSKYAPIAFKKCNSTTLTGTFRLYDMKSAEPFFLRHELSDCPEYCAKLDELFMLKESATADEREYFKLRLTCQGGHMALSHYDIYTKMDRNLRWYISLQEKRLFEHGEIPIQIKHDGILTYVPNPKTTPIETTHFDFTGEMGSWTVAEEYGTIKFEIGSRNYIVDHKKENNFKDISTKQMGIVKKHPFLDKIKVQILVDNEDCRINYKIRFKGDIMYV